jgi:hypothetical protein
MTCGGGHGLWNRVYMRQSVPSMMRFRWAEEIMAEIDRLWPAKK